MRIVAFEDFYSELVPARCTRCGKPIADSEADDNGGLCEVCAEDGQQQLQKYLASDWRKDWK